MLIVKRRKGEGIVIGGNVTITILESTANRVKLGVVAADNVSVRRVSSEILTEDPADAGSNQGEVDYVD